MGRLSELDSLKGIACLFVLLFHYTTQYAKAFETEATLQLLNFKYGGYGVDLFFVISGFVILLTINKVKTPKEFIYKRFSRLYPTFWICVCITFFLVNASELNIYQRDLNELVVNLTMVPDIFGVKRIDGAYWSLLPELFFYFLMFNLLIFNKVKSINLICFIWLLLIGINSYSDVMPIRVLLNLRFGYLFILGINFYKIKVREANWQNHLLIILSFFTSFFVNDSLIKHTIVALIIAVFYLFSYGYLKWLKFKFLIKIGEISYALYLLHQFIGFVIISKLINLGVESGVVLLIVPTVIVLILAFFVTEYMEKPINRL